MDSLIYFYNVLVYKIVTRNGGTAVKGGHMVIKFLSFSIENLKGNLSSCFM